MKNDHKETAHRGRPHGGKHSQDKNPRQRADSGDAWSVDDFQVPAEEGQTRFHDLGLENSVMRGIADQEFRYCSPIQAQILPHTLQGHDAIGKAQTGTGKTAAFLITIFNDLLNNPVDGERFVGEPRSLVIAPTRELVMQIAADAQDLGRHTGPMPRIWVATRASRSAR
jgi:ATP-dependent RNA helicase RhlB